MSWKCREELHEMDKPNTQWTKFRHIKKPVPVCRACEQEGRDGRPSYARPKG